VPQNISTEAAFKSYIASEFPLMDKATLAKLENAYAIPPAVPGPLFNTLGDKGPTALNQSGWGIGQQQRANNLYAETTFICPSYWLASGFGQKVGGQGWKYQFSVPPAEHAADLMAYAQSIPGFPGDGAVSLTFKTAMQLLWGRFIIYDDPTLPASVVQSLQTLANGTASGDRVVATETGKWLPWGVANGSYPLLSLNMTGGVPVKMPFTFGDGVTANITQHDAPGFLADWRLADGYLWEGGRGQRCDFWAEVGKVVPE
jgi:hypothetical protein